MKYQFTILKATRINMLNTIESLSLDELNYIPKGFNNNIAWNFNHSILVMHLLTYKLCSLDINIKEEYILKYKKGVKAVNNISKKEIDFFKMLALKSVEKLEKDYNNHIFRNYTQYPTSYNVVLNSVEDAISFNNVHEGLHFGYIMALKKAVKNVFH